MAGCYEKKKKKDYAIKAVHFRDYFLAWPASQKGGNNRSESELLCLVEESLKDEERNITLVDAWRRRIPHLLVVPSGLSFASPTHPPRIW